MENTPETNAEVKSDFGEIIDLVGSTNITVYERLNASNDSAAKAEFVANPEMEHPKNEYGNLDEEEVRRNLATLEQVEEKLEDSDLSEKRRRLVRLLADDCKTKNEFLAANIAYNAAETPEEKAQAAEWHRQTNEELYGKPDEDTFYTLLREKIDSIDVANLSEEDRKIYDWLMAEIGPLPEKTGGRFKPKPETVQRFGEMVREFFGAFLKHIPEDRKSFTSEEVVDIINEIADTEFGGLNIKYRAVIDPKAANASTNHEERTLKFPAGVEYSRKRAQGLIVHEFGTHMLRAVPYLGQEIQAFASELPGNETFDEGIAKCTEQAIDGKYADSGIDHYINIGLATFKGKNFREIYQIQMALKHLTGESDKTVLNAVQRCFRGTGELVNNKDLAYYNGANQVWQYIEEHIDDPELFDSLFLTGKANMANPAQEALSYEMRTSGI
ncbi:DUF1704 domain-containing protein [Candidatus Saccharibacteria bacterium]|nr:DUF1704 domain-containing protein [Candidatus Saccharibacteria bacterium]